MATFQDVAWFCRSFRPKPRALKASITSRMPQSIRRNQPPHRERARPGLPHQQDAKPDRHQAAEDEHPLALDLLA